MLFISGRSQLYSWDHSEILPLAFNSLKICLMWLKSTWLRNSWCASLLYCSWDFQKCQHAEILCSFPKRRAFWGTINLRRDLRQIQLTCAQLLPLTHMWSVVSKLSCLCSLAYPDLTGKGVSRWVLKVQHAGLSMWRWISENAKGTQK